MIHNGGLLGFHYYAKLCETSSNESQDPNKSFIVIWSPQRKIEDYYVNVTHQIGREQIRQSFKANCFRVLVPLPQKSSTILQSKITIAPLQSTFDLCCFEELMCTALLKIVLISAGRRMYGWNVVLRCLSLFCQLSLLHFLSHGSEDTLWLLYISKAS